MNEDCLRKQGIFNNFGTQSFKHFFVNRCALMGLSWMPQLTIESLKC